MGWGICFSLDGNVLYCVDGCKWRKTLPLGKSGCEYVLKYFQYDIHRELDMIRDECPGTAAALKEACEEHVMEAINSYESLPDSEKARMSAACVDQLKSDIESYTAAIKATTKDYNDYKKEFKNYKLPTKRHKTRADELHDMIYPLQLELEMENAALKVDQLTKSLRVAKRMLKLEVNP